MIYYITLIYLGFKAHKSYETCLETRNNTLMLAFNSVDSENIPENGEVTYIHPETGLSITTILRNCSLQDELDNVSLGIYGKCLFWIICPTTY